MTVGRPGRPRLLGPEPRAQLRRPRRAAWLCDARRGAARARSPRATRSARSTADFDELLADPELDAVVIATPVPTHYALAKQALEAGKHVLVEKPPAMRGDEMDELVVLAEERDLVLMPGHLLLYHPGVPQAEGADRHGRARRRALRLRQPPEPRDRAHERERALVARRPRPLGDPLPARRGAVEAFAHGRDFLNRASRTSSSAPALPVREDRPHAPVVARPAQDAADDRRRPREDGRLRRHGARAQGDRSTTRGREAAPRATASGRRAPATSTSRRSRHDEPLRLECRQFLRLVARRAATGKVARRRCAVVRVLERSRTRSTESLRDR